MSKIPVRAFRLSDAKWRAIEQASRRSYQKPSDFIRQAVDERVAKVLGIVAESEAQPQPAEARAS